MRSMASRGRLSASPPVAVRSPVASPSAAGGPLRLFRAPAASCFRWSVPVKRLTARRFHPLQSPSVNERGKSWRKESPNDDVRFRRSDRRRRHRHILGNRGRDSAAVSARTHGDGGNRAGIRLADHARPPPNVVIAVACHELAAGDLRELTPPSRKCNVMVMCLARTGPFMAIAPACGAPEMDCGTRCRE